MGIAGPETSPARRRVPLRSWSLGRILVFFQGQLNSHKRRAEGQEETASGSDKGAQRLPWSRSQLLLG